MSKLTLNISTSPHVAKGLSTDIIMKNVVIALLPASAFGVYVFGSGALLVMVTSTFFAVLTEHILHRWIHKNTTVSDYSAAITGLLLGMCLPPAFPLWMTAIGSAISIALGKFIFGGLGCNVFNPALVGRAFLQAAFPGAITTWTDPFAEDRFLSIPSSVFAWPLMSPAVDGVSGATPLSAFKFDHVISQSYELAMGFCSGSAGETGSIFLLLGGIYLAWRKMLNWRIPVSVLLTVFIFSGSMHLLDSTRYPSPVFMLFAGGLMLGAVFMATDMVASPVTSLGVWVYGAIIGILVVLIRLWGGLPEGVMYAILLANAVSPHIDNLIRPRVYGTLKKVKESS